MCALYRDFFGLITLNSNLILLIQKSVLTKRYRSSTLNSNLILLIRIREDHILREVVSFKFQSDSINTGSLLRRSYTSVYNLNSNLILLIPIAEQYGSSVGSLFKFQSDSINTTPVSASPLSADYLNSNLILLIQVCSYGRKCFCRNLNSNLILLIHVPLKSSFFSRFDLNSNLILLIHRLSGRHSSFPERFKFQSDSINTHKTFMMGKE